MSLRHLFVRSRIKEVSSFNNPFQKWSDTVAQFILDKIKSTKSLEFSNLFVVFINDFELGNRI